MSLRFKELEVLGHTNFMRPREQLADALQTMCRHAAAGELRGDAEVHALDDVAAAWEAQAHSPGHKLVVVP